MDTQTLNLALGDYLQANPWIPFLLLWIIIWKALALWQSARSNQKIWFIALLIVNTVGILEIIYLVIANWPRKSKIVNPLAPKHFSDPKNPNLQ